MANWDHADNIGTHPAYSKDPETALRARLDAARVQRTRAEETYTKARNNLRVFLEAQARSDHQAHCNVCRRVLGLEDTQEVPC